MILSFHNYPHAYFNPTFYWWDPPWLWTLVWSTNLKFLPCILNDNLAFSDKKRQISVSRWSRTPKVKIELRRDEFSRKNSGYKLFRKRSIFGICFLLYHTKNCQNSRRIKILRNFKRKFVQYIGACTCRIFTYRRSKLISNYIPFMC